MARTTRPLTPTEVLNAKPDPTKQKRLFDGKGLFLLISPKGGKWWRFKYQLQGKTNILSLGIYPEVSLANARDYRDAVRKQVAAGIDPSQVRRAQRAATLTDNENSFEVVARHNVCQAKKRTRPLQTWVTLSELIPTAQSHNQGGES